MPTNVINLQHRNVGIGTYPFTDYSTLTSIEEVQLAPSTFIDANLYPVNGGVRQYISSINRNDTTITVTVSDAAGITCTGTMAVSSTSSQIVMKDVYGRTVGLLIGNQDLGKFIGAIPEGELTFNSDGLEFVATCVSPQPQTAVDGITLEDNSLFAGDVWLVGKDGVVLQWDDAKKAILLHLVSDPLFRKRNCDTGNGVFKSAIPLQALTFVTDIHSEVTIKPDQYGNVRWVTGANQNDANVLRVETSDNGVRLKAIGNIT